MNDEREADSGSETGSDVELSLRKRRTSLAISALERRGSLCGARNTLRASDALLVASKRGRSPSLAGSGYRTDRTDHTDLNSLIEGVESAVSDFDSPPIRPAITPRTLNTNSLLLEAADDSIQSDSKNPITLLRITKQQPPDVVGLIFCSTSIVSVTHGGPAFHAGLKAGMRITSVNGERVLNEKCLTRAIAAAPESFTLAVDTTLPGKSDNWFVIFL